MLHIGWNEVMCKVPRWWFAIWDKEWPRQVDKITLNAEKLDVFETWALFKWINAWLLVIFFNIENWTPRSWKTPCWKVLTQTKVFIHKLCCERTHPSPSLSHHCVSPVGFQCHPEKPRIIHSSIHSFHHQLLRATCALGAVAGTEDPKLKGPSPCLSID